MKRDSPATRSWNLFTTPMLWKVPMTATGSVGAIIMPRRRDSIGSNPSMNRLKRDTESIIARVPKTA